MIVCLLLRSGILGQSVGDALWNGLSVWIAEIRAYAVYCRWWYGLRLRPRRRCAIVREYGPYGASLLMVIITKEVEAVVRCIHTKIPRLPSTIVFPLYDGDDDQYKAPEQRL